MIGSSKELPIMQEVEIDPVFFSLMYSNFHVFVTHIGYHILNVVDSFRFQIPYFYKRENEYEL